jgi:small subunit ribosomal protein S2
VNQKNGVSLFLLIQTVLPYVGTDINKNYIKLILINSCFSDKNVIRMPILNTAKFKSNFSIIRTIFSIIYGKKSQACHRSRASDDSSALLSTAQANEEHKYFSYQESLMVTMKDLLECGVHFGHQTRRWNPKMKKYIFGVRKNIYIIDLQKTLRYFRNAYQQVVDAAAEGQTVLFVGTKKQARVAIRDAAVACGMPYVDNRWLGGMLTNFPTIQKSIRKLDIIEEMQANGQINLLTKKEALMMERQKQKLIDYLGGIRHMKTLPDMMFVIDAVKEHIAVQEARNLGIRVVAPLDTNCDPDVIDIPIPGNDDAIRSIQLFCKEMAEAINEGKALRNGGNDEAVAEEAATEEVVAEEA